MIKRILLIVASLAWILIALVWIQIPLLNTPLVLLAMPVFKIFPTLAETNKHVTWHFGGLMLHSAFAYIVLGFYFWLLMAPLLLFFWWRISKNHS